MAAAVVSLAALILRRPDAFTMPWFYGEEGRDFYAQAWNEGWPSLFRTANGYFHLYPRLIANACVALHVPIDAVPWVNMAFALAMTGVVWTYAAIRFPGPPVARLFAAGAITLLPLGNEIWMTMTNIQWPMALLIPLILLGDAPRGRNWRMADSALLALACLTGPNALVLAPLVVWRAWRLRGGGPRVAILMVLAGALLAGGALIRHGDVSRTDGAFDPLDPGFAQALFFQLWFPVLGKGVHALPGPAQAVLAVAALVLLVRWRKRSSARSQATDALLACAALFFAAAMVAYRGEPGFLSPYYAGIRNFYLPAVLLCWAIIAGSDWSRRRWRAAWAALLLWWSAQTALFVGAKRFRTEPMRADTAAWASGEPAVVPIDPPGWQMELRPR